MTNPSLPKFPLLAMAARYAEAAYEEAPAFCALARAEEKDVEFVSVTRDGLDVQVYIHTLHAQSRMVVAVRGSEPGKWDDWAANLSFDKVEVAGLGVVHHGFLREARAIEKAVRFAIQKNPGYQVLLTGHSKGGSIVTVLQHVCNIRGIAHTFGECRCLGRVARGLFQLQHQHHYRWVNSIDPVPRLLWWCGYHHVGDLVYLDREGRWLHGYASFWDRWTTRLRNPFGGMVRHSMSRYRELLSKAPAAP